MCDIDHKSTVKTSFIKSLFISSSTETRLPMVEQGGGGSGGGGGVSGELHPEAGTYESLSEGLVLSQKVERPSCRLHEEV
jgi:hypothetical protein